MSGDVRFPARSWINYYTMSAPIEEDVELHCPMCEYDLRGLEEPRCPECGYRFTWEELRDPAMRKHPYLFEHHPERNVRAFFSTLIGGLRPRKFWSTLHPLQPSRPRRLWIYFAIAMLTGLVPAVIQLASSVEREYANVRLIRAQYVNMVQTPRGAGLRATNPGLTPQQIALKYAPQPTFDTLRRIAWRDGSLPFALAAAFLPAGWALLTCAAMMIFQFSMELAKVKPIHALRCVLYSADVVAWVNFAAGIAFAAAFIFDRAANSPGYSLSAGYLVWEIGIFLASTTFIYRMIVAAWRYLRFDHTIATILVTQFIVLLCVIIIVLYTMFP